MEFVVIGILIKTQMLECRGSRRQRQRRREVPACTERYINTKECMFRQVVVTVVDMSYRYCTWSSQRWCAVCCYSGCGCDEMTIADQRDLIRCPVFVAYREPVEDVYPRGNDFEPPSLNHLALKTLIRLVDKFVAKTHSRCKVCPLPLQKIDPDHHYHWHYRHWRQAYDTLTTVYGFPWCIARYTIPKIPLNFKVRPDGRYVWNLTEMNYR